MHAQAASWNLARPAAEFTDSARVFGFTANDHAARPLSVVPASGSSAATLQARFIDCLFIHA
jgi:hypothetical protein